jgi:hypothetical protein
MLIVKALMSKTSQELVHVHGGDIKADRMVQHNAIVKALAIPWRNGAGLWVKFEVLNIHCELQPHDTMHVQFGCDETGHGNGFRRLHLVTEPILLKSIPW